MYICNNCEAVFSSPDTHEEHHPYGMGTAAEHFSICPSCSSTDFEEAKQCERCGELFAHLEYVQGHKGGLCEGCHEELYGE